MGALQSDLAARSGRWSVPFHFVECRASAELCKDRLRERAKDRGVVSDGRLEVFDEFAASWEPVEELDPAERIVLDTSEPLSESLAHLERQLPAWPSGLRA